MQKLCPREPTEEMIAAMLLAYVGTKPARGDREDVIELWQTAHDAAPSSFHASASPEPRAEPADDLVARLRAENAEAKRLLRDALDAILDSHRHRERATLPDKIHAFLRASDGGA